MPGVTDPLARQARTYADTSPTALEIVERSRSDGVKSKRLVKPMRIVLDDVVIAHLRMATLVESGRHALVPRKGCASTA